MKQITIEKWYDKTFGMIKECAAGSQCSKDYGKLHDYELISVTTTDRPTVAEEPKKPREFWAIRKPDLSEYVLARSREEIESLSLYEGFNPPFKVSEIPPGHKLVSREMLVRALDGIDVGYENHLRFLRILGLE